MLSSAVCRRGPGFRQTTITLMLVGEAGIALAESIPQLAGVSMSESPILSVIIVAYKSGSEIGAAVASLPSALMGRCVEVFVIDNSLDSDGTGTLLREEFPHIQYIVPAENLGFGRANNLGYARSRGECVLFLNPDTVSNAAALEHCLGRVLAESEVGLISPKLVMADGGMDLACRRSIPTLWDGLCRASGLAARFHDKAWAAGYNLTHLPETGSYDVGAINGAFMLGRRAVFDEIAPDGKVFDEAFFMYGDDLDLCIRVARAGRRIVYDGSVAITHLKGLSVAKNYEAMSAAIFDANRDVYLKHFNPRNSPWVRWKWRAAFGAWKVVARLKARLRGHRRVRPL
jgi:N-acetylglucosaminyl-diphospho-decaprenol L-rhamnosyltransferase